MPLPATALLGATFLLPSVDAQSATWRTLATDGRAPLEYALVTPSDFDPRTPHPVLLALPMASGDRTQVERMVELWFATVPRERGWVVVVPAAPEGKTFHTGGEAWIPPLLDALERELAIDGRMHLAGVSNGGRGAFRVAAAEPARFASLTVMPGVPMEEERARLAEIAVMPIALYVGEGDDAEWKEGAVATAEALRTLGARDVVLDVRAGEEHLFAPAFAVELFDRLDRLRAEERARTAARAEVGYVLDDLHDAAAKADEVRYFGCFAPEAIFIGTDATERWTLAQFQSYAREPFQRESAWTYTPLERHVEIGSDGATAWFDERLFNAKYGETRGSGVLVLREGRWRIAHYVLSFAIPNDAAAEVVEAVGRAGK